MGSLSQVPISLKGSLINDIGRPVMNVVGGQRRGLVHLLTGGDLRNGSSNFPHRRAPVDSKGRARSSNLVLPGERRRRTLSLQLHSRVGQDACSHSYHIRPGYAGVSQGAAFASRMRGDLAPLLLLVLVL